MDTVIKPKNPGRVAAGKRTAEINRKGKEDLLRNQKAVPSQVDSRTDWVPTGGGDSWKYSRGAVIADILFLETRLSVKDEDTAIQRPENDIFHMN